MNTDIYDALRELVARGYSLHDLATAATQMCDERVIEMSADGYSDRSIAEDPTLGIDKKRVQYVRRKARHQGLL